MKPLGLSASGLVLASALIHVARASDLPAPVQADVQPIPKIERLVVDSSSYVSSFGGSVDLNGTISPWGSVNESGWRLRGTGSVSWYKFLANESPQVLGSGRSIEGDFLAGYEIARENFSVIGLIGLALGESESAGVSTAQLGLKLELSSFATPTDWMMTYNSFSYSTIGNFSQLQSKLGGKLIGDFYAGPEVNFTWRQQLPSAQVDELRVGAHLSGWQFGRVLFSFSGGWAHDRQVGSGEYISLNLYSSF